MPVNPADLPGMPGGDTIRGLSEGLHDYPAGLTAASPIPALPTVWLAPDASLMQSHLPAPEGEPVVIHVVGVADYGNWMGAVLMLD